mgnify:CR=1 FL=1
MTHPQKNVIIRAIQGSEHPTEADVVLLKDIQAGDYFFMCTDGVLERLKNEDLSSIFSTYNNPEDIKDGIMAACCGKTRDNFSFYILPVQNVGESRIITFFCGWVNASSLLIFPSLTSELTSEWSSV